jgi:hypothetical protein
VDSFSSHGAQSESGATSNERLEGERAEVMGLGVHSGTNFICVMIHFPRKKIPFCFNHPCYLDVGSRGQKVWKFKRF